MRGYNICIKPGGTAGFSLLSQQRLLRQEFFCSEEGKQAAAQQTFVFTRHLNHLNSDEAKRRKKT